MVDLESCDKPKRKCGKEFMKQFDPQPLEPLNFTDRTGKLVWLRPTSLDDMLKLWENPAYQCVLRKGLQVVQSSSTHKIIPNLKEAPGSFALRAETRQLEWTSTIWTRVLAKARSVAVAASEGATQMFPSLLVVARKANVLPQ